MREIKFRVYDKQFKKWIRLDYYKNSGAITIETDGTLTLGSAFRFTDSMMIVPEKFELMQYTGLKDKNGKEIYEGDIVYDEYSDRNGIIEYSEEDAQFQLIIENEVYNFSDNFGKDFEIIGNKYDNPELLEEE